MKKNSDRKSKHTGGCSTIATVLLICIVFWLYPLSAQSADKKSGDDILVDVTGSKDACALIRAAFATYFSRSDADMVLRITGRATVTFKKFLDLGEYRLCAGLGEGLFGTESAEPLRKQIKFRGSIIFDDLFLSYDARAQNKPAVIFQLGSFYNIGWQGKSRMETVGAIFAGGRISGRLSIRSLYRRAENWTPGRIPGLPIKNMNKTSTVAWFETGILRLDMTSLSLIIEASELDDDDIGLLHQHSWGVRRGPMRISNMGVGLLFYGNSVGSIEASYVYQNDIGLALGDYNIGGDVVPSENCLNGVVNSNLKAYCGQRNSQVVGLSVNNTVIEGNYFGNVVINDAERIEFNSVHLEMPLEKYQKGHGLLIGGGQCTNNRGHPCGGDADCASGRCAYPPRTVMQSIRFSGGVIGGDRFSDSWDGIVIGGNAKRGNFQGPQVVFDTFLKPSDLKRDEQLVSRCIAPGVLCGIISYRKGATAGIDISRATYPKDSLGIYETHD